MCSNCDCGSKKGQVKESSFQVNQVNGQLIEMDDRSPGRPSRNSKTLCLMWTWGTTKKKMWLTWRKKDPRDWKEVNLENKERKNEGNRSDDGCGCSHPSWDHLKVLFFSHTKYSLVEFFPIYIFCTAGALVFIAVQGQSSGYYLLNSPSVFCFLLWNPSST